MDLVHAVGSSRGKRKRQCSETGGAQDRLAERHPFVLIVNHQLSEKRPAPKTPRSILTSRRVARVRNFTSVRGPMGFHRAPDERPQCPEYISLVLRLRGPSCSFCRPPISPRTACVCVRAPVPISAYFGSRCLGGSSGCCSR